MPYFLDVLMLLCALLGLIAGLLTPEVFLPISPYAIVIVAIGQFISFLPVRLRALFHLNRPQAGEVIMWSGIKVIVMPLFLWALTAALAPEQAPGMIMAGGAATAVMAPMLAGFLGGEVVRVMQVVLLTSITIPFTLPFLLKLCLGAEAAFSLFNMFLMLALAVVSPSLLVLFMRRFTPRALRAVSRPAPYIGRFLVFFTASSLIAPYAGAVLQDVGHSLFLFALAAGAVLAASGLAFSLCLLLRLPAITGVLVLGLGNFGLSAATASHFLGQDATILAMGFMLPGFLPVPFLRLWADKKLSLSAV
jgi:BASS family bile acid:Na+ symporter